MGIKYFVLLFALFFENEAFTTSQLETVKSVSDKLIRRQILIIKNVSEKTEKHQLVEMVKYFSNFQIYTSFRSFKEMHSTLYELIGCELIGCQSPTYQYHPKTMTLIYDDNDLSQISKLYFNVRVLYTNGG